MSYEKEIFKGKTLSNIFEEIYTNSKTKDLQIKSLISQLTDLVESPGEATLIVPLIKEYLDVSVRNSEHLIKLAGIIQRLETKGDSTEDLFDFEELQGLIEDSSNDVEPPKELKRGGDEERDSEKE